MSVEDARALALFKALDSLSRYKFMMFGYYAALWVSLNSLAGERCRNPFRTLVNQAKYLKYKNKVVEELK